MRSNIQRSLKTSFNLFKPIQFRSFSAPGKNWRELEEFSVEDFLENKTGFNMDTDILRMYVQKAAKHSLIKFEKKEQEEQFLSDFRHALIFVKKLDEVNVEGVTPLENVLDFYGGNYEKMRVVMDEFNTTIETENEDDV